MSESVALHALKTHPHWFALTVSGAKRFEIRKNDRRFRAGDLLELHEWDPASGYTGLVHTVCVRSLFGELPGMEPGYVLMQTEGWKDPAND